MTGYIITHFWYSIFLFQTFYYYSPLHPSIGDSISVFLNWIVQTRKFDPLCLIVYIFIVHVIGGLFELIFLLLKKIPLIQKQRISL